MEYLLENGSQASAKDLEGCTALHRAAGDNYETFLKHGASLDTRDNIGRTPLHYLCQDPTDSAVQVVQDLISRGICLSVKDDDGLMPLDLVLSFRSLDGGGYREDARVGMLRLLIDSLSNAGDWADISRWSRLIWHFASGGYAKDVLALVEKGGSVHATGKDWRTPLHQAAGCWLFKKSDETVAVLIAHGADVNRPDKKRRTALQVAAKKGNDKEARLLIEHGSVVDYQDRKRRTALHLAALNGRMTMVKILLEAGADPCLQDHKLQTPRDLAARRNRKDIMATLTVNKILTPGSTLDPDRNATSESKSSEVGVDYDYGEPGSDDSRDDDSVRSMDNEENAPSVSGDCNETRSLCDAEGDAEDDERSEQKRTRRRSSI